MKILKRMMIILILGLALLAVATYFFMKQKPFGKLPEGERLARVRQSPNYRDGQFHNVSPTPMIAEDASYAGMIYKFFTKPDRDPSEPIPFVKTDLKALQPDTPALVWFGHSSYLLHIDGKNILVDPVLDERASPVPYAGAKPFEGTTAYTSADLPPIDVVVITHDHYDHLGYHTINSLKARVPLFCMPLGVGQHLEHWGVPAGKIREFDWWEGAEVIPGVQLTATPARHFSGRGFSRNKTLWASFVLQTGGFKIFIGGDSGYDTTFKSIGDKFGPFDLAMLESGQYDKQWPFIHMMPEQTVQAAIDIRAKALMPVHWGKFTLALHPWRDPIERVVAKAEEMNVDVITPMVGEPVVLSNLHPMKAWWR